jgi:hypothetical protein
MAHASILDLWNAGTRLVTQGLDILSKEKRYELDQIAYSAGLRLDTEMYKILQDTQNSNNPEAMQAVFQNRIQEWKNTVAYPGGNNSKYYLDKIENIAAQAGATFEKKHYEQQLFRDNQRLNALLAANLDNTYAAEDDPDNPNTKLFRGFELINNAFSQGFINPIEKRKEELTWANRILSNKLQTISDVAKTPEDLRAALDAVSPEPYDGFIAGQDIARARESAYKQGLNRIQGENQTIIQNKQAVFREKHDELISREKAAYDNMSYELIKQLNAGDISPEEYYKSLEQIQQTRSNGGFRDAALLREVTALANDGKAFRESTGPGGLQNALVAATYFQITEPDMLLRPNRSGGSDSSGGDSDDSIFDNLAQGVYAQSVQRPGESMGWPFNAAVENYMSIQEAKGAFKDDDEKVEAAMSKAEAEGAFKDDDEAGTQRQAFRDKIRFELGTQRQLARSKAVYEIGKKLTQYATSNNLAGEGNFFARMLNETKSFMDKTRAAAMLGKSARNVTNLELERLQEDLWNQVMNVMAEVGTEPESRDALKARIGTIYTTYTDRKLRILRDNAQSESTALSDPNKVAEAMRLITEYPELYNEGYFGDDYFGENIDDTARAYMNTAANLLVNALGWPNDGNALVDIGGNQVIAARGGEKYRVVGEKRNGRETLVVQKEETVNGKKEWQEDPAVRIDARTRPAKIFDFLTQYSLGKTGLPNAGPQALPRTPRNRFGWKGVQGVRY